MRKAELQGDDPEVLLFYLYAGYDSAAYYL